MVRLLLKHAQDATSTLNPLQVFRNTSDDKVTFLKPTARFSLLVELHNASLPSSIHERIGGLVVKLAVAMRSTLDLVTELQELPLIRPAPGSIPGRCIFCLCDVDFVFLVP